MNQTLTLWGIAVASFTIALSGALMPGPVLAVTISLAPRRGFWAGPLVIVGHGILEAILVVALAWGLSGLMTNPTVTGLIGLLGGGLLVWMGISMFRNAKTLSLDTKPGAVIHDSPIAAGMLGTLSNPYWYIWWAGPGLAFISKSVGNTRLALTVFFVGHILGDLAWYSLVSLSLSMGKRLMSDGFYRGAVRGCAALVNFFGLLFVYYGARTLTK